MYCEFSWDNGDLTWYRHVCRLVKGHDGDHECACGALAYATVSSDNPTPDAGGPATAGPASRVPDSNDTMESPK